MNHLETLLNSLVDQKQVQNIAVRVGRRNEILYQTFKGENTVNKNTLFDMASVSKILCTTTLSLIAIDKGLIKLDDTVDKFFACPKDKKNLTIFNLLTHTIGIGHKSLNVAGNTYENIAEYILKIPCDIPVGSNVLYSCPGFILLGKILEKVFGKKLDVLFKEYVCDPLNMNSTSYLPRFTENSVNSNLQADKKCVVNDYNCAFLGGVAGNAGVFSNLSDLTKFAQFLLNKGAPLISENTFDMAIKNHTPDMNESRGLGFVYVDKRYAQTGDLFGIGSIGHCGHTGQSLFVDLKSGFYVIVLSDATITGIKFNGKENYDAVMDMRQKIHNAILSDIS